MKTKWTSVHSNPFAAIREAADANGTPDDLLRAVDVFKESMGWSNFDYKNYADDLLQEIAGITNIVVQYVGPDGYRAAYDGDES